MVAQRGRRGSSRRAARSSCRSTAASTASANAASVVTRIAGESGPCSAWVMRSAATRRGSAGGAARTMPSDGPAGRSMPTSPQTSILAAVTQALPGPTIRSTGAMPASGRPYASAPIAWAPPATMKASTSSRPAAPSRTGSVIAGPIGGRGDDDRADAGDLCRDDGHHQRRRVRRRSARDVGADAGQRRPAPLDLDAWGDRRAGGDGPLGLGEAPDVVDRLVEGSADAGLEAIARGSEVVRIEDEAAVGSATTDGGVRVADGGVAPRPDVRERRPGGLADGSVGDGAAADEASRSARASGSPAATAARSRRRRRKSASGIRWWRRALAR